MSSLRLSLMANDLHNCQTALFLPQSTSIVCKFCQQQWIENFWKFAKFSYIFCEQHLYVAAIRNLPILMSTSPSNSCWQLSIVNSNAVASMGDETRPKYWKLLQPVTKLSLLRESSKKTCCKLYIFSRLEQDVIYAHSHQIEKNKTSNKKPKRSTTCVLKPKWHLPAFSDYSQPSQGDTAQKTKFTKGSLSLKM